MVAIGYLVQGIRYTSRRVEGHTRQWGIRVKGGLVRDGPVGDTMSHQCYVTGRMIQIMNIKLPL